MSDNVPQEVWHGIFTYMRDSGDDDWQDLSKASQNQRRSTLVPLLLTCRYFRNIAEPLLYENVVVYLQPRGSGLGTVVDALQAREERRGWVKTLVATWRAAGRKDTDDESRSESSTMVEAALEFIPRLQGLHLSRTPLSDEIYQWIVNHPTLRTLILQKCDFTQKGRHKINLAQSNITTLTLSQSSPFLKFPFGEVSYLFALPHLTELTITVPFFNRITTLLSVLPFPKLHTLQKLTIQLPTGSTGVWDSTSAIHFSPFLLHSPNLTHLVVQNGVKMLASGIAIPSLDHLKVLQAPAEVVSALRSDAAGLESLAVNGVLDSSMMPLFGGKIRNLCLDIGTDVVAASVAACPALLSLTLRLRPMNRTTSMVGLSNAVSVTVWVQTMAAQDLASLSHLEHLSFQLCAELAEHREHLATLMRNSRQRERKVIANLHKTLPELKEVRLPSARRWRLFNVADGWGVASELP